MNKKIEIDVLEMIKAALEKRVRLQLYQLDYALDYQAFQEDKLSLDEQIEFKEVIEECNRKISEFLYSKKINNRGIYHNDIRNTEGFKSYCLLKKFQGDFLAIDEDDIIISNDKIDELIKILQLMKN